MVHLAMRLVLLTLAVASLASGAFSGVTSKPDGNHLAQFGVCYASTGQGAFSGSLLTIDPETGVGTMIGDTGLDGIPGLAIDNSGVIYGIDRLDAELYTIDASTGASTFVGGTGLIYFEALAFSPDNTLYGIDDVEDFYRIDPATAIPTLIGNTGDRYTGLAFDPTDGTLYSSTGGQAFNLDAIATIDPATGEATIIGTTGLGGATPDLHFDDDGNLFGSKGGGGGLPNDFIAIDKATGVGTVIGDIGFTSVSGLATRSIWAAQPISCADVSRGPQARCRNGSIQVRVMLNDDSHDGESLWWDIDGVKNSTQIAGKISKGTFPGHDPGIHTVSLLDCDPVETECTGGSGVADDWNLSLRSSNLPRKTTLLGNYPNPFNPTTTIEFQTSDWGYVTLEIYNLLGQKVATPVNEALEPGSYTRQWDSTDQPAGVYFSVLRAGDYVGTSKLLLVK